MLFAQNPLYNALECATVELHVLNKLGKNDSEAADLIRESMEMPWYKLTQKEQHRLEGLSADLYSLSGEEGEPLEPKRESKISFLVECNTHLQQENYEALLICLRHGHHLLAPSMVAAFRAMAYAALGHTAVGNHFFEHAIASGNTPCK